MTVFYDAYWMSSYPASILCVLWTFDDHPDLYNKQTLDTSDIIKMKWHS